MRRSTGRDTPDAVVLMAEVLMAGVVDRSPRRLARATLEAHGLFDLRRIAFYLSGESKED